MERSSPELDDLLSDEAVNQPFRYYERLRALGPVVWNERWNGWIVTGYDEVVKGYLTHDILSSDRFSGPFGADMRAESGPTRLLSLLSKFFVWKDPPSHTRMRAALFKAFAARSVESMRPKARDLTRDLAEDLRGKGSVDFLSEFAFHLPVIIISDYLGVPVEAREQVRAWSQDLAAVVFVKGDDRQRLERAEKAMAGVEALLQPLIDARRKNPADDLISTLIAVEHDGERLSDEEIIANMLLLVFAGHETTMNLLTNAVVAFNQFPGEWARLRTDPSLARTATEEALRYDGPIRALGRWAKTSFELGGKTINTRDRVLLIQHAANRDPKGFGNPDVFDITRQPNRHVAFGTGIHLCLGAPLARLETQEALAYLASTFERIEVLELELRYNPTIVSRSLERLNVRVVEH